MFIGHYIISGTFSSVLLLAYGLDLQLGTLQSTTLAMLTGEQPSSVSGLFHCLPFLLVSEESINSLKSKIYPKFSESWIL